MKTFQFTIIVLIYLTFLVNIYFDMNIDSDTWIVTFLYFIVLNQLAKN